MTTSIVAEVRKRLRLAQTEGLELSRAPTDLARLCDRVEELEAPLREDLAYHEEQVRAWGDPDAGDPDERDHHQRRVDVLRAALGGKP